MSVQTFSTTIKVKENLSKAFQEWMQNDHFPKMHRTGCFLPTGTTKTVDSTTEPGFHIITFSHRLENEAAWKKYNKNPDYRAPLRAEFKDKWGQQISAGEITFMVPQQIGEREELEF